MRVESETRNQKKTVSTYNINLHEAIYSLSDALDLVGVTHIHHGKRVAYMAAEFGKYLEWGRSQLDDLFQSAILHDCGVSKTTVHAKLAQFEWELEGDHCKTGASLLASSPLLQHLAPVVLHHHTHWSSLKDMDLPIETKLNANCIYMADRVDILTLRYLADEIDILLGKEDIRKKVAEKCGDWFCRELVDAFMEVSRSEAFWFSLETSHVNSYVTTWISENGTRGMTFEELRSLARASSPASSMRKVLSPKNTLTGSPAWLAGLACCLICRKKIARCWNWQDCSTTSANSGYRTNCWKNPAD